MQTSWAGDPINDPARWQRGTSRGSGLVESKEAEGHGTGHGTGNTALNVTFADAVDSLHAEGADGMDQTQAERELEASLGLSLSQSAGTNRGQATGRGGRRGASGRQSSSTSTREGKLAAYTDAYAAGVDAQGAHLAGSAADDETREEALERELGLARDPVRRQRAAAVRQARASGMAPEPALVSPGNPLSLVCGGGSTGGRGGRGRGGRGGVPSLPSETASQAEREARHQRELAESIDGRVSGTASTAGGVRSSTRRGRGRATRSKGAGSLQPPPGELGPAH